MENSKIRKLLGSAAAVTAVLVLSACPLQRVYVWNQSAPPAVHWVRLNVDPSRKSVSWLEVLTDKNGEAGRQIYDFGAHDCEMFDEDNWSCALYATGGTSAIKAEMKEGNLTMNYWGQEEVFRPHYFVFGYRID